MKPSAAFAHIRQLCSLDLDSRVLVPAVLDVLPDLVPVNYGIFFWSDEEAISAVYCTDPLAQQMVSDLAANPAAYDDPSIPSFGDECLKFTGVMAMPPALEKAYRRSRIFNEVTRPAGVYHLLPCPIFAGPGSYALLPAGRGEGEKPFSEEDKKRLATILPFLASALKWGSGDEEYVPDGKGGLLVLGLDGKINYACPRGRQLLRLSVSGDGMPPSACLAQEVKLLSRLSGLAGNVAAIHSGRAAPPPVITLRNRWGLFRFRAYLLQNGAGIAEQAGVQVEHLVPAAIPMMRALSASALSPRQREVALHLAEGRQNVAIAERLGLSPHTVGDVIKEIYLRLGVNTRQDLREKLLHG